MGKSKNLFIRNRQQNMVKAYDSLIQSIRTDVTMLDDIDATSFGFQEFLNIFDRDQYYKISPKITQIKHGFLIMQLLRGFIN